MLANNCSCRTNYQQPKYAYALQYLQMWKHQCHHANCPPCQILVLLFALILISILFSRLTFLSSCHRCPSPFVLLPSPLILFSRPHLLPHQVAKAESLFAEMKQKGSKTQSRWKQCGNCTNREETNDVNLWLPGWTVDALRSQWQMLADRTKYNSSMYQFNLLHMCSFKARPIHRYLYCHGRCFQHGAEQGMEFGTWAPEGTRSQDSTGEQCLMQDTSPIDLLFCHSLLLLSCYSPHVQPAPRSSGWPAWKGPCRLWGGLLWEKRGAKTLWNMLI